MGNSAKSEKRDLVSGLFLSALEIDKDFAGVPSQQPFAAVLSCSDARVPVEMIFHEACNDLSVVLNSAMMAMSLQQIMEEVGSTGCPVVYGVYDLSSRLVWGPNKDSDAQPWVEPQLDDPLASLDEFEELATRIAT
jgi:hypothetical protein